MIFIAHLDLNPPHLEHYQYLAEVATPLHPSMDSLPADFQVGGVNPKLLPSIVWLLAEAVILPFSTLLIPPLDVDVIATLMRFHPAMTSQGRIFGSLAKDQTLAI